MVDELSRRIPGWLMVGVGAARGDEAMGALRASLGSSGVAALERVAAVMARVQAASGREASVELLGLTAVAQQIGGARARLAEAPGKLEPLPVFAGVHCEALPEQVEGLRGSIESGLRVGPGTVGRDLRLIASWVQALDRSSEAVEGLLERHGELAAAYLRDGLDLRGGAGHGRRVEALARLNPERARGLIEQAWREGSLEVKASALRAWARVDAEAARAQALAVLTAALAAGGEAQALLDAAVAVVGGVATDEALATLVALAARPEEGLQGAGIAGLAASTHPAARGHLRGLFPPEIGAIKEGTSGSFRAASAATFERYTRLLRALQGHLDDALAGHLGEVLKRSPSNSVRAATRSALALDGSIPALTALWSAVRAGQSYQDEMRATELALRRNDPALAPLLVQIVDQLDKADRQVVYLGLIQLGARGQVPWLLARARVATLTERERSLVSQALSALHHGPRG